MPRQTKIGPPSPQRPPRPARRAFLGMFVITACTWAATPAPAAPQRIVSAAPSITEMLYTLGLGDRVVGVTTYCHYPPAVREKQKIGNYMNPSFETILAMRPDLVVVLEEHRDLVEKLRRFDLPLLALQHNDLAGIYRSLESLGEAAGVPERAAARVAALKAELAALRRQTSALPSRGVMFVVGRTPATVEDLVVVGRASFLNELIAIAGGRNIFESALTHYPRIPREEIYARGPEVIIDMGDMGNTDAVADDHHQTVAELWEQMPGLPAVRTGRVYPVAEDIFVVPGPRVVETARRFFAMIHPEAAR